MNEAEVKAYDLRTAAIHEAGHATIAAHFGVEAAVALWANRRAAGDESLVLGRLLLAGKPPTPEAATLIALAGAVAALYADDRAVDADGIADAIETGESTFSESDAKAAGAWKIEDVAQCLELVRHAWPAIEHGAAKAARAYTASGLQCWAGKVNGVTV